MNAKVKNPENLIGYCCFYCFSCFLIGFNHNRTRLATTGLIGIGVGLVLFGVLNV